MSNITLSEEQLEAINNIINFVYNSKDIAFSLTGSAGTGKTLILNTLIKKLNNIPVVLCAPTHKAKLVLEKATNKTCSTLHSLLALTPNLDIFELDLNALIFQSNDNKISIPSKGLVICDEASMINDNLYTILINKCTEYKSKILFVSDSKQLRPVKEEHESLVYTVKNNYNLTKIFRQDKENALHPILETLRSNSISYFEETLGKSGSLLCFSDVKEFIKSYIINIKKAAENSDILATKLTAYTNARINLYNTIIKKILFNDTNEFNVNEFITGCDNFNYIGEYDFYNSMDYIITNVEPKIKYLPNFNESIEGSEITLYDSLIKDNVKVFSISKNLDTRIYNKLAYTLEDLRIKAIRSSARYKKIKWQTYYDLFKSFATPIDIYLDGRLVKKKTFTGGYACTIHKLQGTTLENIFVDMKDVNKCLDPKIKQQLQYVALSRTSHNVYMLQ